MSARDHSERDPEGPVAEDTPRRAASSLARGGRPVVARRIAALAIGALVVLVALLGYVLSAVVRDYVVNRTVGVGTIESWQVRVDRDPQDARSRLGLASALQASGQPRSALAEYETVLKQYPYDIAALYGRGAVLTELDRPKEAEAALRAVLARDKSHVRAAEDLGDYYASTQQYSSLLEAVSPAVMAHPTEARLQYLMGLAYEHQNHSDWALSRYRLALEAVPDMPEALEGVQRVTSGY